MNSKQGCTKEGASSQPDDNEAFATDLHELSNHALRLKYPREASSHASMKRRCRDGRFELDPAWDKFREFLRDLGPRTSDDATLDRIDTSRRKYGPGLCRWATKTEQTINRSNTVWLDFIGQRMRLQEFADAVGAPYSTVYGAISRGELPDEIAARLQANEVNETSFVPMWIRDDDKLREWRLEYEKWRKRVRRDRRALAYPEVYAAIVASEAFHNSTMFLNGKGLSEMTPTEHALAQEQWPSQFRCLNEGIGWIKHAIRSLRNKDIALAGRIVGPNVEWREIRHFELWLIASEDN